MRVCGYPLSVRFPGLPQPPIRLLATSVYPLSSSVEPACAPSCRDLTLKLTGGDAAAESRPVKRFAIPIWELDSNRLDDSTWRSFECSCRVFEFCHSFGFQIRNLLNT
jgi:hypothetical protein